MHNPAIIKLGSHGSTDLVSNEELGTVEAGLVSHRKSDGSVTVLASDGEAIGVSLGDGLDGDGTKSSIARAGNLIPVQITAEGSLVGNVQYVPKVEGVSVQYTPGGTAGSEIVTVVGRKITVQIATATSTATQVAAAVNAKAEAMALLVSAAIQSGQGSTAQVTTAETAVAIASYVVPGGVFRFSATTGKATSAGTITGATFASGLKYGLKNDGSQVFAAWIDMAGGL